MKSPMMRPPILRRRSWRAISSAASRFVCRIVFSTSLAALVAAGVHVDRDERLGFIDHDVAAALQPDLAMERVVDLLLNAERLEDRRRAVVDTGCGCATRREIWPTMSFIRSIAARSSQITSSISSVRKSRTVRSTRSGSSKTRAGRLLLLDRLLDLRATARRDTRDRARNNARAGPRRRCG